MRRGRGESVHTLVLTIIKTQVLANFYFKKYDPTFDFEIINLVYWNLISIF